MVFGAFAHAAAPKALSPHVKGKLVNDLPAPFNLQAQAENRSVVLHWEWQPPEQQPLFTDFGYEILRADGQTFVTDRREYADTDLEFGTYTYRVRVRGGAKDHGRRLEHVSAWSEPASAILRLSCTAAPRIELQAEATQKSYSSIPSLRLHLKGRAAAPEGCTVSQVMYHIDSGTGLPKTGPLKVDAQGRFDEFVDAIGPEDEVPEGEAIFSVTVTAQDEAAAATSNAYSVSLRLQNKFAPH